MKGRTEERNAELTQKEIRKAMLQIADKVSFSNPSHEALLPKASVRNCILFSSKKKTKQGYDRDDPRPRNRHDLAPVTPQPALPPSQVDAVS